MKKLIVRYSLVLIFILAAVGSTLLIYVSTREYEITDKEVTTIIDEQYTISLPEGTELPEGTQRTDDGKIVVDTDGNFLLVNGSTINPDDWFSRSQKTKREDSGKSVSLDDIKARYEPTFADLQAQASEQLNLLVSRAKREYKEKIEAGDMVNPLDFYQKYTDAAEKVEAKTDAAFETSYKALQSELTANDFSVKEAEPYKEEYERIKKEYRDQLMP